jgi:hypothetical protein
VDQGPDLSGAIDLAVSQEELLILHADGGLDRCQRAVATSPEGGTQYQVECEAGVSFKDEREGHADSPRIPGALAAQVEYSPPPEPSLYFLDVLSGSLFHYSMRLVYQAQYVPTQALSEEPSAFALGPPNDLFLAVGDQVFTTKLTR